MAEGCHVANTGRTREVLGNAPLIDPDAYWRHEENCPRATAPGPLPCAIRSEGLYILSNMPISTGNPLPDPAQWQFAMPKTAQRACVCQEVSHLKIVISSWIGVHMQSKNEQPVHNLTEFGGADACWRARQVLRLSLGIACSAVCGGMSSELTAPPKAQRTGANR